MTDDDQPTESLDDRRIVAALAPSATAPAVLLASRLLAEITGADVAGVHVAERDAPRSPSVDLDALAAEYGVPLDVLSGPVEAALVDRIGRHGVVGAVVGARDRLVGGRPAGHVALAVAQGSRRPVLVVPPDLDAVSSGPWRRVLVPLEGTLETSDAVLDAFGSLVVVEMRPVVLHVFTPTTAPPALDRPSRDLDVWGDEFLARHAPAGARIEHRCGVASDEVARACHADRADLVVLSWSQVLAPDRAAIVQEVLRRSPIPVLLLPLQVVDAPTVEAPPVGVGPSS